jgi:hypothetical protein
MFCRFYDQQRDRRDLMTIAVTIKYIGTCTHDQRIIPYDLRALGINFEIRKKYFIVANSKESNLQITM